MGNGRASLAFEMVMPPVRVLGSADTVSLLIWRALCDGGSIGNGKRPCRHEGFPVPATAANALS
jgi:hypothetical protein